MVCEVENWSCLITASCLGCSLLQMAVQDKSLLFGLNVCKELTPRKRSGVLTVKTRSIGHSGNLLDE